MMLLTRSSEDFEHAVEVISPRSTEQHDAELPCGFVLKQHMLFEAGEAVATASHEREPRAHLKELTTEDIGELTNVFDSGHRGHCVRHGERVPGPARSKGPWS